ncbi:MAG: putative molybdenum carrier protein [Desulfobacterales bacterium]|jgi:hypothetical protein|nr:putative molybdenum carrier protein [Desulfobacterales bacterium]
MIVKLISGGQTGVDRAALDAAIRLGVPHGGWVPKGRLAEDGPLPQTYAVQETASAVYAERTEKNVVEADGTLIISRGKLCGGSAYTREMAVKHHRPWLHVDLDRTAAFRSAMTIRDWIAAHRIGVLNVAGPRASKDPLIYRSALALIETVYYLSLSHFGPRTDPGPAPGGAAAASGVSHPPQNVHAAVEQVTASLPLKDRVTIANMSAAELPSLFPTLGEYILNQFFFGSNPALMNSCRWVARREIATDAEAAREILRELWKRLSRTHALRRIK